MGRYGGTYAHWQIGMNYSQYLDPEFAIWCNQVVRGRFELAADPEDLCIPIAVSFIDNPVLIHTNAGLNVQEPFTR